MNYVVLFEEQQVRRVWHAEAWWFVIADVVAVLTYSVDPVQYLKRMRQRDSQLNEVFKGWSRLYASLHCLLILRVEGKN